MRITDDGAIKLAHAIIFQAINDYLTGNKTEQLDALRFLSSEWCNTLMGGDKQKTKKIGRENVNVWGFFYRSEN